MKKISFKLRLNYTNKNNEHPLLVVFTNDKKVKVLQAGINVQKKHWDKKTKKVLHFDLNHVPKNNLIESFRTKATNYILKENINNENKSLDHFVNYVLNYKLNSKLSYYEFALNHIDYKKNTFSKEHIKGISTEISKLKKFKEQLFFDEINYEFLKSYEIYMRGVLKNKTNTVHKSFKRMKAMFNEALKQELITKNPFTTFTIATEKTNRTFLTIQELQSLEQIYIDVHLNDKLKNVLQYFLFSCYTGLRFTDVLNLTFESLQEDTINIIMHKTNEFITIPIIERAAFILKELSLIRNKAKKTDKIFNVLTNQKTNEYLKIIMLKAEINKEVSFHTSRHTFATTSISLGIPLEVLQKIMGHTAIKTTGIYAKIIDVKKQSEMKKWNSF